MRPENNNIKCNPTIYYTAQEKLERKHLYNSKYHTVHGGIVFPSFYVHPTATRALNRVIAYFLNKLNPAFIINFLSLLLLSLLTSSISYAVKKA